jgi:hypothetical protein
LSIQKINTSHSPSVATALLTNIRAKQSAAFSVEAHLPQMSVSQKTAALPQVRHSTITPQTNASAAPAAPLDTAPLPTTLANSNNPTAMWTPAAGLLNNGNPIGPVQNPQPQPFYVVNSNYNPADPNSPAMIQDPTATAAPQPVQWTSANGLTTTGVMNPFGLTQNNPGLGFFGGQG